MRSTGPLTNGDYRRLAGVDSTTARADLKDLVARGLAVQTGQRRGARYGLAPTELSPRMNSVYLISTLTPDGLIGRGFLVFPITNNACSYCCQHQKLPHGTFLSPTGRTRYPWAYLDLNQGPLRYQRSALTA